MPVSVTDLRAPKGYRDHQELLRAAASFTIEAILDGTVEDVSTVEEDILKVLGADGYCKYLESRLDGHVFHGRTIKEIATAPKSSQVEPKQLATGQGGTYLLLFRNPEASYSYVGMSADLRRRTADHLKYFRDGSAPNYDIPSEVSEYRQLRLTAVDPSRVRNEVDAIVAKAKDATTDKVLSTRKALRETPGDHIAEVIRRLDEKILIRYYGGARQNTMTNVAFEIYAGFSAPHARPLNNHNEMSPGKEGVPRKRARALIDLPGFGHAAQYSLATALYRGVPVTLRPLDRGRISFHLHVRTGHHVGLSPGPSLIDDLVQDLSLQRQVAVKGARTQEINFRAYLRLAKRESILDWTTLRGPEDICKFFAQFAMNMRLSGGAVWRPIDFTVRVIAQGWTDVVRQLMSDRLPATSESRVPLQPTSSANTSASGSGTTNLDSLMSGRHYGTVSQQDDDSDAKLFFHVSNRTFCFALPRALALAAGDKVWFWVKPKEGEIVAKGAKSDWAPLHQTSATLDLLNLCRVRAGLAPIDYSDPFSWPRGNTRKDKDLVTARMLTTHGLAASKSDNRFVLKIASKQINVGMTQFSRQVGLRGQVALKVDVSSNMTRFFIRDTTAQDWTQLWYQAEPVPQWAQDVAAWARTTLVGSS
ncbi:unnamed protein product [Parajaminaea phylloscopi]